MRLETLFCAFSILMHCRASEADTYTAAHLNAACMQAHSLWCLLIFIQQAISWPYCI